jgi:hypothetical protein
MHDLLVSTNGRSAEPDAGHASDGASMIAGGFLLMQNDQQIVTAELRPLLDIEVADIVATANQHGCATRNILVGVEAAVSTREDPDPADDSPAAPTSVPSGDLVDKEKTLGLWRSQD